MKVLQKDTVLKTAEGSIGRSSLIKKSETPKSEILKLPANRIIFDGLRSWWNLSSMLVRSNFLQVENGFRFSKAVRYLRS